MTTGTVHVLVWHFFLVGRANAFNGGFKNNTLTCPGMIAVDNNLTIGYIGDTIELALEPVDAFGEYDAELVQIEPASAFPQENLKEGAQFEGEDETGEVILYTVTNIADGKVVVDGNHPWAGQRIIFKASIKDVRSANQEEVSHQHVHGAGGHHH